MDSRISTGNHRLPEEIVEEILSILPAKSLLRFRGVSRSWRRLIDSERLINTHLQNSRANKKVILCESIISSFQLKQCSLHSMINDAVIRPSPAEAPSSSACVVGCCNGMVCIWDSRFYLWNPATKIRIALPEGPRIVSWNLNAGFGWDETTGAFKVFVIMREGINSSSVRFCSSETNEWKTGTGMDSGALFGPGKFLNGKIYWKRAVFGDYMDEEDVYDIVSYDLKDDVVRIVEHPSDCRCSEANCSAASLGVLDGFLCFAHDSDVELNVWIMRESWVKVMALPLSNIYYLDHMAERSYAISTSASFLDVGPNGEILMTYRGFFLVYDPKERLVLQRKKIEALKILHGAHIFCESLVSPVLRSRVTQ